MEYKMQQTLLSRMISNQAKIVVHFDTRLSFLQKNDHVSDLFLSVEVSK